MNSFIRNFFSANTCRTLFVILACASSSYAFGKKNAKETFQQKNTINAARQVVTALKTVASGISGDSNSITITVNEAPSFDIMPSSASTCDDNTPVTFIADVQPGSYTYQWTPAGSSGTSQSTSYTGAELGVGTTSISLVVTDTTTG